MLWYCTILIALKAQTLGPEMQAIQQQVDEEEEEEEEEDDDEELEEEIKVSRKKNKRKAKKQRVSTACELKEDGWSKITLQIFPTILDMIWVVINYHLVMKTPIYFSFKIWKFCYMYIFILRR